VIDQNRDAQMLQLIKLDIAAAEVVKLRSVCYYTGHPLDARFVTESIASQEQVLGEDAASNVTRNLAQNLTQDVIQEQKS
jgi:hypothetical protein